MNEYLQAALDPAVFSRSVGFKPDPWQMEMLRTTKKRVILNCARQTGKSTTTAVSAEHRAVFYPRSLLLIVSPSLKQSQEVFKKITDLRQLEKHPQELVEDTKTSCMYGNGSRILCLPGSESSIRGYSAPDVIILDEAARVPSEVLTALRPMLATVPDAKLVLLSTPNGRSNEFARIWHDPDPTWLKIEVLATECPRISTGFLRREVETLPQYIYAREYQCSFASPEGSLFRMEDLNAALDASIKPLFGGIVDGDIKSLYESAVDDAIPAMGF